MANQASIPLPAKARIDNEVVAEFSRVQLIVPTNTANGMWPATVMARCVGRELVSVDAVRR